MSSKLFILNEVINESGNVRVIKEELFDSNIHLDISDKFTSVGINLERYIDSGKFYKVIIVKGN